MLRSAEQGRNLREDAVMCTCNRLDSLILCKICGNLMKGRLMTPCPVHPRVYHLMDYSHCPICHGTYLKEFSSTSSKTACQ